MSGKRVQSDAPAARKRRGRPSLIEDIPVPAVKKAHQYALLGLSDERIAGLLGVATSTFYLWIKRSSEFSEAIKSGRDAADAAVADALYQNATGYKRVVEKEVVLKTGNGNEQRVEVVSLEIEEPPNTAAGIFWLKNRQRDYWKDIRASEVSGPNGAPISTEIIPVKQLAPEERARLRMFLEQYVTDVEDLNEEDRSDAGSSEEANNDEV